MSNDNRRADGGALARRDFLAAGAVPLAATLGGVARSADAAPVGLRSRQDVIRIGVIGAGANARSVVMPGFQRQTGVQLFAVANRSLESSQRAANQFDIPRAYANWRELLDDDDVDAVFIGTWPYMHHTLTLAALEAGKHVLCQARMANDAQQAREMLAASLRYPDQVTQLVPTSTSYRIDNVIKRLLGEGYVGEVLSVELQRLQRRFPAVDGELDWRHDRRYSGYNILNLGSTYESLMRWLGPGNRVMAMTQIHVPERRDASGEMVAATLPDHVDVVFELSNGAQAHLRASETSGLSPGNATWIHGTQGTIHVDAGMNVFAGRRGDSELTEVPNPPEQQAYHRVEEEFINAIRGVEEVTMATFETGVRYMEFTEAVHRSADTGQAVYLPL